MSPLHQDIMFTNAKVDQFLIEAVQLYLSFSLQAALNLGIDLVGWGCSCACSIEKIIAMPNPLYPHNYRCFGQLHVVTDLFLLPLFQDITFS